jgi:toxin-antitoxin system PIN domain toxin
VKLADTNVLLAAVNTDARGHRVARAWLETNLSGSDATGFAWLALVGFVRLATKTALFASPLGPGEALDFVEEWLAQPNATVLHPGARHARTLRELIEPTGSAGNLTSDAHLAAIAIEHGATLATFDAEFHRFRGLRLEYLRPGG